MPQSFEKPAHGSGPPTLAGAGGQAVEPSAAELPVARDGFQTELTVSSPFTEFWKKFRKQKLAMAAAAFIILLLVIALIGPSIAPYRMDQPDYNNMLAGPSLQHLCGTDEFGRDIFSRILAGTRISLWVGLSSVAVGAVIGTILGLISGYYGKWVDAMIMRISDVLLAFPGILLAIGIIAILGPGLNNVIIAVAIFGIPIFARIVRSSTLALKSTVYVEAARSLGARNRRLIWKHIFPGTASTVIVYFTMRIGTAILTAASLSFLGLGAQPPTPEWGAMLSSGRDYLTQAPHVAFFPGMAIFLTVLAFNLFGDGLRDALDPKIKG
ncbi:Oligopeptide transport permease C-like, N-terminal domain protein [Acididesulfobacillus acetoxydans]|uniref:Glutathione transport system permease protein GsiD n=1 Tax=Acididesulfobacillus acetoxydans TaxID=1561005 RepID=A0A8S0XBC4_9FIRM|nr:Oligopeptide transport permease C-like, N-terminal domain protein [Acididesulfobacillus acetoxydans]CEJ06930.1 Glutathione transport system permease protein GsiD [Acididesulfobacillus acetoxydans]